jgi:rSAM/selenodomain-associated transferase 2
VGDTERTSRTANECRFSVVIPVLREADRINTVIDHILQLSPNGPCQIIVADADPDGATINAIKSDNVLTTVSERGRAKQMNAGAAMARGEMIVFLHADTFLPSGAFERIEEVLKNGHFVAGAFDLAIDSTNLLVRFIAAGARFRSRLTHIPYGDQAIFIRKDYFEKIGRFREIPLMEDVELMRRIKRKRHKICILPEQVTTSARRWQSEGIIYTALRNLVLVTLFFLGVSPGKLARYYKSGYKKQPD